MRIASIVLTAIGMAVQSIIEIVYIAIFAAAGLGWLSFIVSIFMIVGVISGISVFVTARNYNKRIAAGVCTLIFTSLLGGIFYLCWNGY